MPIKRALISVFNKTGIVDFARTLTEKGVDLLSTGGTYRLLQQESVPVTEVADWTGTPEIMDGRVKTLHPKIHGGILAIRDNDRHVQQMEANEIGAIDLVVVNLYPFEATISKEGVSLAEAVENIDIGGPTMLRSAAKNNAFVTAVVDPSDYSRVLKEMEAGDVSADTRMELAGKVFAHTARYDSLIANYLGSLERGFPPQINFNFMEKQPLRYGENPHQRAFFYEDFGQQEWATVSNLKQLQGKELSCNNIIDLSSALEISREFDGQPFCCILKHTNPCGAALGENALETFESAWTTDPTSAFGSIIGFTTEVDGPTAKAITRCFVEIVTAPSFTDEALELFAGKKNLRIMQQTKPLTPATPGFDLKKVSGGLLVQDADMGTTPAAEWKVVTEAGLSDEDRQGLEFAWKICKHIKSNAICYASSERLLGVGAGQMSRVDSARIGAEKAQSSLKGCYLASDAFFPFRDGVDAAARVRVKAIVQPGGSVRDQEVIDACNEHGIAMAFTGRRHFRH